MCNKNVINTKYETCEIKYKINIKGETMDYRHTKNLSTCYDL